MENKNIYNKDDYYLAKWLEGAISDEDLKRKVSQEDFLGYEKLKAGLKVYEKLEGPLDDSFKHIQDTIQNRKPVIRISTNLKLAIAIAASIVLFVGLYSVFDTDFVTYETSFAEQKTIILADGSEVVLNAKSLLSFDEEKWVTNREVFLNGEAYFKVEKGSTFVVKTDNGEVLVLGTQFNVNSNDDYFEVSCYEGKVKVMVNAEETILYPNKVVRRINGFTLEHYNIEIEEPFWIKGESRFRSVPLKYVISALEDQYNITFEGEDIDDTLIFTGSFTHKNLQIALASVFKTMRIDYVTKNDNVVALSNSK